MEPDGEEGATRERFLTRVRPQFPRRRFNPADRTDSLRPGTRAGDALVGPAALPRGGARERDASEMISELQAQMSALVDGLNAAASVQTPWERHGPAQRDAGQTGSGAIEYEWAHAAPGQTPCAGQIHSLEFFTMRAGGGLCTEPMVISDC